MESALLVSPTTSPTLAEGVTSRDSLEVQAHERCLLFEGCRGHLGGNAKSQLRVIAESRLRSPLPELEGSVISFPGLIAPFGCNACKIISGHRGHHPSHSTRGEDVIRRLFLYVEAGESLYFFENSLEFL